MSRNEVRTWNAERFGHDVEGPCWNCGQAVAYFVDEMGTPREIRATERRLTVEKVREAIPKQATRPEWRYMRKVLDDLATAAVDEEEGK